MQPPGQSTGGLPLLRVFSIIRPGDAHLARQALVEVKTSLVQEPFKALEALRHWRVTREL